MTIIAQTVVRDSRHKLKLFYTDLKSPQTLTCLMATVQVVRTRSDSLFNRRKTLLQPNVNHHKMDKSHNSKTKLGLTEPPSREF